MFADVYSINTPTMADFKLPKQLSLNTEHDVKLRSCAELASCYEPVLGHEDH